MIRDVLSSSLLVVVVIMILMSPVRLALPRGLATTLQVVLTIGLSFIVAKFDLFCIIERLEKYKSGSKFIISLLLIVVLWGLNFYIFKSA